MTKAIFKIYNCVIANSYVYQQTRASNLIIKYGPFPLFAVFSMFPTPYEVLWLKLQYKTMVTFAAHVLTL